MAIICEVSIACLETSLHTVWSCSAI